MSEPLADRIVEALADRRPSPSRDFEARLERASERAHQSFVTAWLAIAVVACAILIVVVMRPAPDRDVVHPELQQRPSVTPAATLPHDGRYSASQCNQCHRPAPPPLAVHQPNGTFPLVGGHHSAPCASCHVAGKPPKRECSSCHTDPHRGAHPDCAGCHPPGSWKAALQDDAWRPTF